MLRHNGKKGDALKKNINRQDGSMIPSRRASAGAGIGSTSRNSTGGKRNMMITNLFHFVVLNSLGGDLEMLYSYLNMYITIKS